MNNENKFTKIVAAAVIIVAIVIGVSYGIYYNGFDDLGKNMDGSESVPQFSPIKPFEAYSTLKQNIIELFGEGKQGEGVSDDTKYIDYKQEWFSIMADTRYYYGKEKRVYKTVLTYKLNDKDKLYLEMKKWLGEPLEDSLSDKEAKKPRGFWIKDSVSYELLVEKNKIVVESRLSYYNNPNQYDMGDRPTIIQRLNIDVTGDKKNDAVLLIGSKANYTDTLYKNLYLLIGNESGAFYTNFPKTMDGGTNPQIKVIDIDKDNIMDILVESDQYYIKNYNAFSFKDKTIQNIYSSENELLVE